jgi:hypothetical protein
MKAARAVFTGVVRVTPSNLYFGIPNVHFSFSDQKFVCITYLLMRAKCPFHLIVFQFITLNIFGE